MTLKEIRKFLDNTKVYVNGKSKEIQEKLFSFGYGWDCGDTTEVCNTDKPFLFIYKDRDITYTNDMCRFVEQKNREITAEQILSIELTESTYRPFKDANECWQEMMKHQPFGWLKSKLSGSFVHLGCISQFGEKAHVTWSTNEKEWFETSFVYGNYTFVDGTPFGIKEE